MACSSLPLRWPANWRAEQDNCGDDACSAGQIKGRGCAFEALASASVIAHENTVLVLRDAFIRSQHYMTCGRVVLSGSVRWYSYYKIMTLAQLV